jgi:hypothetical protein
VADVGCWPIFGHARRDWRCLLPRAERTSLLRLLRSVCDPRQTSLEMFAQGPIRKSMLGATFITALKTHAPTRSVNGIETTENSSGYPHCSDNAVALLIHASASTRLESTARDSPASLAIGWLQSRRRTFHSAGQRAASVEKPSGTCPCIGYLGFAGSPTTINGVQSQHLSGAAPTCSRILWNTKLTRVIGYR